MDQSIDDQGSSSTEGWEMNHGDEVWIKAIVLDVSETAGVRLAVGEYGREVWIAKSKCKPVEPEPVVKQSLTSDAVNPSHYNQGPIKCIDAMQIVLTAEEYRGFLKGNAIKYLWREENKNGIEDLRKAKWYLDRLIELFDESETEQPVIKQSSTTEPPDGWRWLEVGEVIRKGDRFLKEGRWCDWVLWVGSKIDGGDRLTIRRNRFKVGEKVVEIFTSRIGVVKDIEAIGNDQPFLFHVEMQDTKRMVPFSSHKIAPYIEETK